MRQYSPCIVMWNAFVGSRERRLYSLIPSIPSLAATRIEVNVLDGVSALPYIQVEMRLYYRAHAFTYRYSYREERAGEGWGGGASKTTKKPHKFSRFGAATSKGTRLFFL